MALRAADGTPSCSKNFVASGLVSPSTTEPLSSSSSTTDFAGRLPPSTIGNTSATGIRPSVRSPAVGGMVFGGSGTFLVAGRRAGARLAAELLPVLVVFAVVSVTRGTLPKAGESASRRVRAAVRPWPPGTA